MVEGTSTRPFTDERGVRQGDPLSPILFDLVMDVLSRMIIQEVEEKKISNYMVNGSTSISHLMYANVILLFA